MSRKRSASGSRSCSLGVSRIRTARPARKPTYAAYSFLSPSATTLSPRLHRSCLSPLRPDPHRLGAVLPPAFHHRMYFHRRPSGDRALVLLPPVLLPLRLVAGRPLPGLDRSAAASLRPDGTRPVGRRRYPVPQTRPR